ncbi:hypothetical protein CLV58_109114 [Spirosoma oryzae]|uniref:Uncharacterized protein n=1 Tax=Spirosoma oryzae TaxID=1469603 RepID=A0A2T0SY99_9BACT|nr:hypothetical protein CLV58_109114 [Spirosoma oryzae]
MRKKEALQLKKGDWVVLTNPENQEVPDITDLLGQVFQVEEVTLFGTFIRCKGLIIGHKTFHNSFLFEAEDPFKTKVRLARNKLLNHD